MNKSETTIKLLPHANRMVRIEAAKIQYRYFFQPKKNPSKGPWFELGVSSMGPKKPRIKPMIPKVIPPAIIQAGKVFEILPIFLHNNIAAIIAIIKEVIICAVFDSANIPAKKIFLKMIK